MEIFFTLFFHIAHVFTASFQVIVANPLVNSRSIPPSLPPNAFSLARIYGDEEQHLLPSLPVVLHDANPSRDAQSQQQPQQQQQHSLVILPTSIGVDGPSTASTTALPLPNIFFAPHNNDHHQNDAQNIIDDNNGGNATDGSEMRDAILQSKRSAFSVIRRSPEITERTTAASLLSAIRDNGVDVNFGYSFNPVRKSNIYKHFTYKFNRD